MIICCNNFINSSLLIAKDIKGRFSISKMSRLSLAMSLTILIIFSTLVPGITVLAADTAEGTTIGDISDPGILPDSGFYFIKSWGRNLQLMFARTDAERARLMLKYTNEDALALEKMYQMGKYDVAAKHAERYTLQLHNAAQTMEQVKISQGKNISRELVDKLQQNYLQQQEVLLSVLQKVPEEAQNGLLNAIENSNKQVAAMIMAQKGEPALQQYQEQVNQQIKNLKQETKIRVQQRLEVVHGQAGQPSISDLEQGVTNQQKTQSQAQTQTQTQIQSQDQAQMENSTQIQTKQQSAQPNSPNQGNGSSNTNNQSGETQGNQYGK